MKIQYACGHEEVEIPEGTPKRTIERIKKFGFCEKCFENRKNEEEKIIKNNGFSFHGRIYPYIEKETGKMLISCYYTGSINDNIRALLDAGYKQSEHKMAYGIDVWHKKIYAEDFEEEQKKAKELGAKLFPISREYEAAALDDLERRNKKKKALESIKAQAPKVPELIDGYRWNERIYGRGENLCIYRSGDRKAITSEEAEELKQYLEEKEKYENKLEKIRNKEY